MCTARRERGTRLDALAGGRQAAFGKDVRGEEEASAERKQGRGKKENESLKGSDGEIDMLNEGGYSNKAGFRSYSLANSVTVFVRKGFY